MFNRTHLSIIAASVSLAAVAGAFHFATSTPSEASTRPTVAAAPPRAVNDPSRPVLVELFTSQGCSSCPPADEVIGRVARDRGIVAITRPVTYWDRLGWRDTLGREANTTLQRAYAARGLGEGSVFTPEAVIGGRVGMIGSREAAVRSAITAAPRPAALVVDGNAIRATGTVGTGARIKFIAVANHRNVRIGGGENGGRNVLYTNVVLDETSEACGSATTCAATVPTRLRGVGDRIAVVLQRGADGEVLAARWL